MIDPIHTIPPQELLTITDQLPKTEYGSQQKWTNGKVTFEFFPEGYIALNKELATGLHPKLEVLLTAQPVDEVDIRLAAISTYCGIALDGEYTVGERDKLCFILAGRLETLRDIPSAKIVI